MDYTFGAYGDHSQPRPIILNDEANAVVAYTLSAGGKDFNIRNLHFVDNTAGIGPAMVLYGTDGVHVANTEIEGFEVDAISADGASNLTIENSILYGGGLSGGGANLKLLHNSFTDNVVHGMYLRDITNAVVDGNLFADNGALGLVIHGTADGVTISGNEMVGNSSGLGIIGNGHTDADQYYRNVLIEDNLIHGISAGAPGPSSRASSARRTCSEPRSASE